ncbi:MAG: alanine dehydrogenase [Candidatus Aenigmarchaeota archaeon]|nr:alanine dehydrogenase [Candidatus Aenigmarchaeota archaeon]
MIVGTVKEIKTGENRVGLTPAGVGMLVAAGHKVIVERGAGLNSGFSDSEYEEQGAVIADTAEVWNNCDMIVKVKEPLKQEYDYLRENLILFTYLHLAAEKELTEELLKRKVTGIAYETVELDNGELPLLTPMSEVAGRMAVQIGAHYLERTYGGAGRLLAGVPGVKPANVVVLGSGVAGINAAKMSFGLGSNVIVIGRNLQQLRYIDDLFHGGVRTLMSNPLNIANAVKDCDLLIGTVAVTGYKAPKLVTREMIRMMKPGSVIVDISIDQGGSIETSRPTTHLDPVYVEENVIHYCVTNMPGAVPHTSTLALTNATLPYALKIASGFESALKDDALAKGVNTCKGKLTNKGVAEAFGMEYVALEFEDL